jgi:putative ABC transport system substrate-binding protein
MRRREFLAFAAGAMALSPVASHAQRKTAIPRVGVLWHAGSAEEEDVYLSVVQKAFSDLGYVDGKSIVLEHRFPRSKPIGSGQWRRNLPGATSTRSLP